MRQHLTKISAALLLSTAFAGCAADSGDSALEPNVETATQELSCDGVSATTNAHLLEGRADITYTPFFIWQIPTYYAHRAPGSPLPQESLGSDPNKVVTLYPADATSTTWSAKSANCYRAPQCGNGRIDGDEVCDGAAAPDCKTVNGNYTGGKVTCNADCRSFVESSCVKPRCGDGIWSVTEECEGTLPGPPTKCVDYHPGTYTSGNLSCRSDCTFDTSACVGIVPTCGNGRIDPGEECDGNLLGASSPSFNCKDYNYQYNSWPWNVPVKMAPGPMQCTPGYCQLDRSQCKPVGGYCYGPGNGPYGIPTISCIP